MRAFCHVWVTSETESERVGMAAAMYVLVGSANVRRRTRQGHAEVDRRATAMHALFTRACLCLTRARAR
jgi:hypothetical protein